MPWHTGFAVGGWAAGADGLGATLGLLLVTTSFIVFLWSVVGLIRPAWGRLPGRAAALGIWLLSVALFVAGSAMLPDAPDTGLRNTQPAERSQATGSQRQSAPRADRTVTAAEYARLATGMTYRQAVEIIGFEGEELSRSEIAGITTVMYQWTNPGFSGANMNAMFQDGGLIQKAQFGLE